MESRSEYAHASIPLNRCLSIQTGRARAVDTPCSQYVSVLLRLVSQCSLDSFAASSDNGHLQKPYMVLDSRSDVTSAVSLKSPPERIQACIISPSGEYPNDLNGKSVVSDFMGQISVPEGGTGDWDIVFRSAQVSRKYHEKVVEKNETYTSVSPAFWSRALNWTSGTQSSDLFAAVACSAIASASTETPLFPRSKLFDLAQAAHEHAASAAEEKSSNAKATSPDAPIHVPIRILCASNSQILVVRVPVDSSTLRVHYPLETGYDRYRGVYEYAAAKKPSVAVELEIPLKYETQLPTGHYCDTVSVSDHEVKVSIVTTGDEAVILVAQSSLPLFPQDVASASDIKSDSEKSSESSPVMDSSVIDSSGSADVAENDVDDTESLPETYRDHCDGYSMLSPTLLNGNLELRAFLAEVRKEVSSKFSITGSVCLVGDMEHDGYHTIDKDYVCCCQADLSVRSIAEDGTFDEWLPEGILRALAVAQGFPGSIAYDAWVMSQRRSCGGGHSADKCLDIEKVRLYAAHPSGVFHAAATFVETASGRRAKTVILMKTPLELMRGMFISFLEASHG